ncbi:MAG TPA: AAA family ATPase [Verrucomicrobiae bacterium]|nr:AAA family ATPase [Verrucomicrobiae bacterium]
MKPNITKDILQVTEIGDVPDPDKEPDLKAEWLEKLLKAAYPAKCLKDVDLPEREPILGGWLMEGDLGFIYGPRGLGKTWLGLHIARKIAEGGSVADWKVEKPRRVLYVDGEMPFDEMRRRDVGLTGAETDNLFYLQHEALFHFTGGILNLALPVVQEALLELCKKEAFAVLVLDNLSCLFNGVNENDADAWEQVLPWLLSLRRERISVIFIAHAGRNGLMRGTSRREDAAFWIIRLDEAKDLTDGEGGARFISRFVKNRNPAEAEPSLEWRFKKSGEDGRIGVSWKKLSTQEILRECVEDGLTSATDIAAEMEISKGMVSRLAARAIKDGWLKKDGRDYALV